MLKAIKIIEQTVHIVLVSIMTVLTALSILDLWKASLFPMILPIIVWLLSMSILIVLEAFLERRNGNTVQGQLQMLEALEKAVRESKK